MFIRPSVSLGTDQPLPSEIPAGRARLFPHDWSRDGKCIVFVRAPLDGAGTDICSKPMVAPPRTIRANSRSSWAGPQHSLRSEIRTSSIQVDVKLVRNFLSGASSFVRTKFVKPVLFSVRTSTFYDNPSLDRGHAQKWNDEL